MADNTHLQKILLFEIGNRQFGMGLPAVKGIHAASALEMEPETESETSRGQREWEDAESGMPEILPESKIRIPNSEVSVPLYDLSSILEEGASACASKEGKVIFADVRENLLALRADRVAGVVSAKNEQIKPLSPLFGGSSLVWFPRVLKKDEELILLLNPGGIRGIREEAEVFDTREEAVSREKTEAEEREGDGKETGSEMPFYEDKEIIGEEADSDFPSIEAEHVGSEEVIASGEPLPEEISDEELASDLLKMETEDIDPEELLSEPLISDLEKIGDEEFFSEPGADAEDVRFEDVASELLRTETELASEEEGMADSDEVLFSEPENEAEDIRFEDMASEMLKAEVESFSEEESEPGKKGLKDLNEIEDKEFFSEMRKEVDALRFEDVASEILRVEGESFLPGKEPLSETTTEALEENKENKKEKPVWDPMTQAVHRRHPASHMPHPQGKGGFSVSDRKKAPVPSSRAEKTDHASEELENALGDMIQEEMISDMVLRISTQILEKTVAREMKKVRKTLREKIVGGKRRGKWEVGSGK